MKGFYEFLLTTKLPDDEVLEWFYKPLSLKDRLTPIKEDLETLRLAIEKLDSSV